MISKSTFKTPTSLQICLHGEESHVFSTTRLFLLTIGHPGISFALMFELKEIFYLCIRGCKRRVEQTMTFIPF